MLSTVINRMVHTAAAAATPREDFRLNDSVSQLTEKGRDIKAVELIAAIVTLLVVLLIISFIGQFLWNTFISGADGGKGLLTIARPAENVWQVLGLYIFIGLFFGHH